MRPKRLSDPASIVDEAEFHYTIAAGLATGAAKILNDFVGGTSWGKDSTSEAALHLISEAVRHREQARSLYESLYEKAANANLKRKGRLRS